MNATDKQRLERANRVAQVIAEHPDLPMMCLAPSTPSDYDSYYHNVCGASVQRLLFPHEVMKLYDGHTFYLDEGRTYDDLDEVADEISDWLWDNECGKALHRFEAAELWGDVYGPIARMMAEDMPWHEYIVIDCY